MEEKKIRVAITHGNTNGIGYELIFKTFAEPEMLELCTPVIYGSPKLATYHRKALGTETMFSIISSADEVRDGRINLITCFDEEVKVELGNATDEARKAGDKALGKAVADMKNGAYDALLLGPLETNASLEATGLQLLMAEPLRVAVATSGMSMKDVVAQLSTDLIIRKAEMLFAMLKRDLRVGNPRVAVLALNSNADGVEEREIITPAVQKLVASGKQTYGPFAASDFFGTEKYHSFDAVLAMYYDQGVAPLKALSAADNIVYVAGLLVPCAASCYGPSFELAGHNEVDVAPFRQALYGLRSVRLSTPSSMLPATARTTTRRWQIRCRNSIMRSAMRARRCVSPFPRSARDARTRRTINKSNRKSRKLRHNPALNPVS